MLRTLLITGAAALALGACSDMNGGSGMAKSDAPPPPPMGAPPTPSADAPNITPVTFVTAAGQSDAFEIQEGQLAQRMGKSQKVRDFGAMMVRDHTQTTANLMTAAQRSGLAPPPAPPPLRPDQQQMMSALNASGPNFDKMYVDQQVASHQEALQLQKNYAGAGTDPNLRAVAAQTVPIVQQHLSMAQQMQSMMMSR